MDKNFVLRNAVTIEAKDGRSWDVHNDFDLTRIAIDVKEKTVSLSFARADNAAGKGLVLRFIGVDYLDVSPDLLRRATVDPDLHLDEIGYKAPNDFDHDWLAAEAQSAANDHVFVRFSADDFVRVHSQLAEVVEL